MTDHQRTQEERRDCCICNCNLEGAPFIIGYELTDGRWEPDTYCRHCAGDSLNEDGERVYDLTP